MPVITESETPVTVTLPAELSKQIRARVAAREYPTAEAAVVDLLQDSFDLQWMSDEFLLREVIPALDEVDADPSCALTPEQVRLNLLAHHERTQKAR